MPVILDASKYATDKSSDFLIAYARYFSPLVDLPITLLEIGVATGSSLELWRDYFPKGQIVGLDSNVVILRKPSDRIHVYRRFQEDLELLSLVAQERAPAGFDIIIDDASHIGASTRRTFWHLFTRPLRPGGLYVIEDWGTGFWARWPNDRRWDPPPNSPLGNHEGSTYDPEDTVPQSRDFPSHLSGMVGVVKEFVDEVGLWDATSIGAGAPPTRAP